MRDQAWWLGQKDYQDVKEVAEVVFPLNREVPLRNQMLGVEVYLETPWVFQDVT